MNMSFCGVFLLFRRAQLFGFVQHKVVYSCFRFSAELNSPARSFFLSLWLLVWIYRANICWINTQIDTIQALMESNALRILMMADYVDYYFTKWNLRSALSLRSPICRCDSIECEIYIEIASFEEYCNLDNHEPAHPNINWNLWSENIGCRIWLKVN